MVDELNIIQLEKKRLLNLALSEGLDINSTKQLETYIKLELLLSNKPTEIIGNQMDNLSDNEIESMLEKLNPFTINEK